MRIPIRPAATVLAIALASTAVAAEPAAAPEPAPVGPPIGAYVFWGVMGGIGGGLIGVFGAQRLVEAQVPRRPGDDAIVIYSGLAGLGIGAVAGAVMTPLIWELFLPPLGMRVVPVVGAGGPGLVFEGRF